MTKQRQRDPGDSKQREAAVFIDHDQAVIRTSGDGDRATIDLLERLPAETGQAFDLRTVREIIDRDRIVVSGPSAARLGFERAYVSMTHRPDRLVDVEPTEPTEPTPGRLGPI